MEKQNEKTKHVERKREREREQKAKKPNRTNKNTIKKHCEVNPGECYFVGVRAK